ncbi:hypothetical protein OROMI_008450 [Orobanche minor]
MRAYASELVHDEYQAMALSTRSIVERDAPCSVYLFTLLSVAMLIVIQFQVNVTHLTKESTSRD